LTVDRNRNGIQMRINSSCLVRMKRGRETGVVGEWEGEERGSREDTRSHVPPVVYNGALYYNNAMVLCIK